MVFMQVNIPHMDPMGIEMYGDTNESIPMKVYHTLSL